MASANRHKRARYWFETVICRVIDVGALNTRAVFKKLGQDYRMADLKRILAHGLAKLAIKEEIMPVKDLPSEEIAAKRIKVVGPAGRMDGSFHCWNSSGKTRKRCVVHRSIRCETNKYCVNCGVYLCDGYAWAAWHMNEDYEL